MEEGCGLRQREFGDYLGLYTLCELVHNHKQEGTAPGCHLEGPDQVEPPNYEGLGDGDGLQGLSRHMSLTGVVLTAPIDMNDMLGVGHGGQPIESLPECLPDECSWGRVVLAHSSVDFDDQILSIFASDALLLDS